MAEIYLFPGQTIPTNIVLGVPSAPRAVAGFRTSPACCCNRDVDPPGDPLFCCGNFPLTYAMIEMSGWGDLIRTGYPSVPAYSDVRLDMRVLNGTHILETAAHDFFGTPVASCQWEKTFTTTVYITNRTSPFSSRTVSVQFQLRLRDTFGSFYSENISAISSNPTKRFMLCDVYQGFGTQGINTVDNWSLATDDETAFDFYAYTEIENLYKRCTSHHLVGLPTIAFQRYTPVVPGYVPYTPSFVPTFFVTAV